jgi:YVTN family beta-propeller protein
VDLQADSANCGACGHTCGASACLNGACNVCEPASTITGVPARVSGSLAGAAARVPLPCGTSTAPQQIYTFVAPETATYVVGTPGAQTLVAILDSCGGSVLACEPDASRFSSSVFVGAGNPVLIVVEGASSSRFDLQIRKAAPDPCCTAHDTPGCGNPAVEACVCAVAPGCCTGKWTETCDALVNTLGCGLCEVERPPSCGATSCARFDATASFLGAGQCCTGNGECGSFFRGRCVGRDQHGVPDGACPSEQVGTLRAAGCCRADGRCGVDLALLDMGCVAREEAPGVALGKVTCGGASTLPDFRNFESDPVRPLALSPDGMQLFAVNTPDARLEIFSVTGSGVTHTGSVPVGVDPVAVAARTNTEVWVVNQISDSVSIVDLASTPPRVARTLWVGDEPRDIVFAGPGGKRAFITTAHRGQNSPTDPQLLTPGLGRADVWVFDSDALGPEMGGAPATVVSLFGDGPRALAVTPDGSTVYAAVYHSGNRTTTISEGAVDPARRPPPTANAAGVGQPSVGLIVKFDGKDWVDDTGQPWSSSVHFSLPDYDVFSIDADATPPAAAARFSGVGTTLFNLAVNPRSLAVYVSNTDAQNEVRFEPRQRARSTDTRITVISGSRVTTRTLNPHIDYGVPAGSDAERALSVGTPTGLAVSPDGSSLYVAALGSSKVAIVNTATLEGGTFAPRTADQVGVSGGGPTGLVLDPTGTHLYVATRFDNGVSVVDVAGRAETQHVLMPNPEPTAVTRGRPLLYDTQGASAHGDLSCFSCHPFGDTDHLSWDLGDPNGEVTPDKNPGGGGTFHPMKGPMATQSLRGLLDDGPMHWRGDRSGALVLGTTSKDTDAAFHQFNGAFVTLLGRQSELSSPDMQAFTDFVMTLTYPPNPIRALDDSLTPEQASGRALFLNNFSDGFGTCVGCHTLDVAAGFFGTQGSSQFDAEPQTFKIPHLRNAYQKVGMFGMAGGLGIPSTGPMGDQIRGFGYLHDGSVDTAEDFLGASLFSLTLQARRDVANFLLAFDSTLLPIVGQQVTLDAATATTARLRLALLVQEGLTTSPRRACDLIGHGSVAGEMRGYLLRADGRFLTDRVAEASLSASDLFTLAADPRTRITFTCMPPGSGVRAGLDRDRDGKLDRDELDAGTDPANPAN